MANYYGTTRTNYFAVKNADDFLAELSKYPVEVITKEAGVNGEVATLYGFMDSDLDGSGDVWNYYNPETHEGEEIHWDEVFARHLADGWVAIIITSGAEKHRYVSGFAKAYNNKGEKIAIDLSDIYTLANDMGEHLTTAEY